MCIRCIIICEQHLCGAGNICRLNILLCKCGREAAKASISSRAAHTHTENLYDFIFFKSFFSEWVSDKLK